MWLHHCSLPGSLIPVVLCETHHNWFFASLQRSIHWSAWTSKGDLTVWPSRHRKDSDRHALTCRQYIGVIHAEHSATMSPPISQEVSSQIDYPFQVKGELSMHATFVQVHVCVCLSLICRLLWNWIHISREKAPNVLIDYKYLNPSLTQS